MSSEHILRGSQREHPRDSVSLGAPALHEQTQLTLLLRRRAPAPEPDAVTRHLTQDELAREHGADPADLLAIEQFAGDHNFTISEAHAGARTVCLHGRLDKLAEAFGATLDLRSVNGRVLRTREGHLALPAALQGRVEAVFGFDTRPAAATYHRVHPRAGTHSVSFTPLQLASLYNFPTNTGAGQTIALVELDGGYNPSDLSSYWQSLGINEVSVTSISVDGAQNAPTGDPNGPDGEVALDIEVAGALAPGANIAVYFAPNTDAGFLNAINAAIHDTVRKPSIISISWGSPEDQWTDQAKFAFHAAFHDAALLGITVLAAAGDNGSSDGDSTDQHVDFPASSSWVLACGGTRLTAANGRIASETVWNDGTNGAGGGGATGGGVSSFFSRPKYQAHVPVPAPPRAGGNPTGRGVPDVAAVADPGTGYNVFIDGQSAVIGGTSAVAPLWAGLFAVCNEHLGRRLGWPHNKLYGTVAQGKVLHDIVEGTNGAYNAVAGWDCCTGLGTPDGQALLKLL